MPRPRYILETASFSARSFLSVRPSCFAVASHVVRGIPVESGRPDYLTKCQTTSWVVGHFLFQNHSRDFSRTLSPRFWSVDTRPKADQGGNVDRLVRFRSVRGQQSVLAT